MRRLVATLGAAALLLAWLPGSAGAQSACTIEGTPDSDVLTGTPGPDVLCGLGGDDVLLGGLGADVLEGGDGADDLQGGPGADLLYGGPANDVLSGAEDTDYLDGGAGNDQLDGGAAMDTCVTASGDTPVSCTRASPFDANDSGGLADLERMIIGNAAGAATWSFQTFANLTISGMRDHAYFLVYLDTEGDEVAEYYALLRSNGSKMLAELRRDNQNDTLVSSLSASKPAADTVRVTVPWSKMTIAADRAFIRWYAVTLYVSDACPDVCLDRVPESSALMRPLP
jgi:Ca2+-binding RTX toxin-like protein